MQLNKPEHLWIRLTFQSSRPSQQGTKSTSYTYLMASKRWNCAFCKQKIPSLPLKRTACIPRSDSFPTPHQPQVSPPLWKNVRGGRVLETFPVQGPSTYKEAFRSANLGIAQIKIVKWNKTVYIRNIAWHTVSSQSIVIINISVIFILVYFNFAI